MSFFSKRKRTVFISLELLYKVFGCERFVKVENNGEERINDCLPVFTSFISSYFFLGM